MNDTFSQPLHNNTLSVDEETTELDRVIAESERSDVYELSLSAGRRLRIDHTAEGDCLSFHTNAGQIELEVIVTERGPVLRFHAADLLVESTGRVDINCEDFSVRATKSILHDSDGDLQQRACRHMSVQGSTCAVCSTRGDVDIEANDDVLLNGERVRLNC